MPLSKILFVFLIPAILCSCDSSSSKKVKHSTAPNEPNIAEQSNIDPISEIDSSNVSYLDSRPELTAVALSNRLRSVNDTSILPFDIREQYGMVQTNFGLLDLNKDAQSDLIMEYYGLTGTGEKNMVDIYFFDKTLKKFSSDPFRLSNPSYYQNNIITSYYYGIGGGTAVKYIPTDSGFKSIEEIKIDIDLVGDGLHVNFKISQEPFSDTIHTSDYMVRLPKEYKFTSLFEKFN